MLKVLFVEDDHLQRSSTIELLQAAFPSIEIDIVKTESEFREKLPSFGKGCYQVAIIDVMLRWADPQPSAQSQPPEVAKEGYRRAGIRCKRLLKENPNTGEIPVILYTILIAEDLGEGFAPDQDIITKQANGDELIARVRRILEGRRTAEDPAPERS